MKKLLFFLLLLPLLSKAQVNILPQTGVQNILVNTFQEIGGAYYFLSCDTSVAAKDIFKNHPRQFLLNKVDKYNNTVTSATIAMGDSLQVDSLISLSSYNIYCLMKKSPDNHIYLFYQKYIKQDFSLPAYRQWKIGIYCTVFDTLMHRIVSDKRLVLADGYEQMYQPTPTALCFAGKNPVLGYNLFDTLQYTNVTLAKYIKLDEQANILAHDTLGIKTVAALPGQHYVTNICAVGDRISVWGESFLSADPWEYSIMVFDTTLFMIDTFRSGEWNGLTNKFSYWEGFTNSILLPTGTLIQGHCAYPSPQVNYGGTLQSAITRGHLNHPFQIEKYLLVAGKDSLDWNHGAPGPPYETVVYNTVDGNLYYANSTHSELMGNYCPYGPSVKNYVQVICADTNLNLKWTRYIHADSSACALVDHVVAGDGRPGVVVCGSNHYMPYNGQTDQFAYYIDSSGSLSVPNTPNTFIRDRFRIYPNPAISKIFVDDVFDNLKCATVYAMDGRVVINQSLAAGKNEMNIMTLPPGLYLIRLMSKDDEVYQTKFIKE
ncbi:T9SS type A sorting domain-containing protein [Taibaiella soli]|uniref:Secretion system C-terminal sorting domain-containing protein n=1 Tax=Taibaiella soli TaxID=1649169 RepID=A0A2W2BZA0_9BACT|nr:T9SS type A sorting domain-containing protein [Taibaiella soli]PZF73173.1 hypothetical protein DN068_09895 [Taibaiella soli]